MKSKLNKRGISLIVLVITIIIMIILAAAVILSLNSSGIIGRAHKAKYMSDLASLKEAYSVVESENILNRTNKTDIEMLLIAAEKCGLSSYFENDGTYTGVNDSIKELVQEKFILSDIVAKGYVVSVVDGTTYITGIDVASSSDIGSQASADILSITEYEAAKYTITDASGTPVSSGDNITTGYIVKKGDVEIAKIAVFGDTDGDGHITASDTILISRYINDSMKDADKEKFKVYAADVDQDGFVSNDDVTYILRYINYWEGYSIIAQNFKVKELKKKEYIYIDTIEYIQSFNIAKNNVVTERTGETGTYYELTLNNSYTYDGLNNYMLEQIYDTNIAWYFLDSSEEDIDEEDSSLVTSGSYLVLSGKKKWQVDSDRMYEQEVKKLYVKLLVE